MMRHFWKILVLIGCLGFAETSLAESTNSPPIVTIPAAPESNSAAYATLKEFFYNLITERDRQYGQRFEAQERATVAALAATEKAVSAAFAAQEKATAAAFAAAKEAVSKAEFAAEKRFDSVNEFRGQLKDQQTLFVQKSENEVKFKSLIERIEDVSRTLPGLITRVESDSRNKSVNDRLDQIDARVIMQNQSITQILSRGEGASNLWIILLGAVGLILTLLAVFFASRRQIGLGPGGS